MDASVVTSGLVGLLGVGAGVWATTTAQKLAREGRFEERRIDAYLEILRAVEHRTLWWSQRYVQLEASGDPQYRYGVSSAPELLRTPVVDDLATLEALLAAFGSSQLVQTCRGWVASTVRLGELHDVAAWNYNQSYHGPDTETDPDDLANIRLEIERLRTECARVGHAVRAEIEVERRHR